MLKWNIMVYIFLNDCPPRRIFLLMHPFCQEFPLLLTVQPPLKLWCFCLYSDFKVLFSVYFCFPVYFLWDHILLWPLKLIFFSIVCSRTWRPIHEFIVLTNLERPKLSNENLFVTYLLFIAPACPTNPPPEPGKDRYYYLWKCCSKSHFKCVCMFLSETEGSFK